MSDYELRVLGHYQNGRPWTWRWFFNSPNTAATVLTAWSAAITDFWTNGTYGVETLYATTTVLDDVEVITLDAKFQWTARIKQSLTLAGTSSDNPMPNGNAVLLHLESPGLRPNERGYTRLPAPVEGSANNGEYTPTAGGRFGTAARALHSTMATGGQFTFVHTGAEVTKHGVAAYTRTTITNIQASGKVAYQRKRDRKTAPVLY